MKQVVSGLLPTLMFIVSTVPLIPTTLIAQETPQHYLPLATTLCQHADIPPELADHEYLEKEIIIRGSKLGLEKLYNSPGGSIKVEIIEPAGRPRRTAITVSNSGDISKPGIWMILDTDCKLTEAKQVVFNDDEVALYVQSLDHTLSLLPDKEWLNPPLTTLEDAENKAHGDSKITSRIKGKKEGLRVALIDSGVNYTLDEIANSLALNEGGELIGYDYWDNDKTPFDANPARSWFFVQRHGTRTASILLREAPEVALVPYRYPRPDMTRMTQLVEHAASNRVRLIGMPLGSNTNAEWRSFSTAVEEHPEILFIVSAGNNGRDIDVNPVYPAVLDHANILVVTSADDYVKPASRTNYGKLSVDYLLPAEQISATDFTGSKTLVSGSSYAVSRMTALAARLLSDNPEMSTIELKARINTFSVKANTGAYVSRGYIGDPMADTANLSTSVDTAFNLPDVESKFKLSLNLVALDKVWATQKITAALTAVNPLYAHCNISIEAHSLMRVKGAKYLSSLSPGNALTLSRHLTDTLQEDTITVFFAHDTHMQTKFDAEAFGKANTRTRPWMRNTLWITSVTPDSDIAIAHELLHVLSNSGQHSSDKNNLMNNRTSPGNTELTRAQCQAAIMTATSNGLMR